MSYQRVKKRVFEIINKPEDDDRAGKIFNWSIMALIVLSIVSIVLESYADIYEKGEPYFRIFEIITVVVFTVEYILRLWTANLLFPGVKHPRLRYVFSFMAIIDLLAILPFYVPFISADLRFLRMMRLVRLMRVFKLSRYSEALQIVIRVVKVSAPQLVVSVVLCFFVVLFSAIVMYTVENPVQPEQFPNVITSLWWAICTLTTVGYGDVYPITDIGRLFASLISLVGIGIIAIPTGIIAAGFNQAINKGKTDLNVSAPAWCDISEMKEGELFNLQSEVSQALEKYGYRIKIMTSEDENQMNQQLKS